MTIDKEQLIQLLIEKTSLERSEVEQQLSELVSRIQNAAETGESFDIEGFGSFSMQDGELQFIPTDTLETEINNKYAGMKPIELIGAFKEADGESIPDISLEDKEEKSWAFDEHAQTEDADKEFILENNEGSAVDGETEQESSDEEEIDQELLDKIFEEPEEDDVAVKNDSSEETEHETQDVSEKTVKKDDEERDPIERFLVAAVVIIALGIGGWVVYDIGLFGDMQLTQASAVQSVSDEPESNNITQHSNQDNLAQKSSDLKKQDQQPTSEPEEQQSVRKQEGPQRQQDKYGLRGRADDRVSKGYTIVIHSLQDLQMAERRQQKLQKAGYRALVSKATVNGTTYFRVGLGQFQSVADAQQAVDQIPEEYQDNNFIKRIQ